MDQNTQSQILHPMQELRLLGGRLCLDFANTVDPRYGGRRREYLGSYEDLLHWAQHVEILTPSQAERLLRRAEGRSDEARALFHAATALREAIYRTFSAIVRDAPPLPADLDLLADAYRMAYRQGRIVPDPGGFTWIWDKDPVALDRILWPVARSAADLLTGADLGRVKECPGAGDCGWLFLDSSKNGSRRWCSMEGCGSRVKMRRQYARRRTVSPA